MQTLCPQCQALYRVTPELLSVADGLVRCGECGMVFDGRDHVTFLAPDEIATLHQDRPSGAEETEPLEPTRLVADAADLAASENISRTPFEPTDLADLDNDDGQPTFPSDPDWFQQSNADETEEGFSAQTSKLPLSLGNYADGATPPRTAGSHRASGRWGIPLGIALLSVILLTQYAWFNRHELVEHPIVGPWIQTTCRHLNCGLEAETDPTRIKVLERRIVAHPERPDALLLSATIQNETSTTQPFPNLRVVFSDLQGETVAERFFHPKDYLPEAVLERSNMPAHEPIEVQLTFDDPGPNALSFQIEFQ